MYKNSLSFISKTHVIRTGITNAPLFQNVYIFLPQTVTSSLVVCYLSQLNNVGMCWVCTHNSITIHSAPKCDFV